MLDGVLGGDDHERRGQPVGGGVDGDLTLLHGLEEGRLRLRGGAVDLVAEDDVGEDAAGPKLKGAGGPAVDGDAGDIARQEVGRELDAVPRAVDRPGQRLGQAGLADARYVLDQQMTLRYEAHQRQADRVLFAFDGLLD